MYLFCTNHVDKSPRVNPSQANVLGSSNLYCGYFSSFSVLQKYIVFLQQYLYDSIPMLKSSIFIFMFTSLSLYLLHKGIGIRE